MRKMLWIALAMTWIALSARSQPFVTGLTTPTRICFSPQGNLLVAEAGTTAPNSGRISLVDRTSRTRKTFVDGLPSGISGTGAEAAPSGPAGIGLRGSSLMFVIIGAGNGVLPGPATGSELANPSPASPILSSLLSFRSSTPVDLSTGGFSLLPSDHTRLKSGETVKLTNASGQTLDVKLIADFPNSTPSPRPDVPTNVRASNPFGVAVHSGSTMVFVVDASQNTVYRINADTNVVETLATIPPIPNPLPFGPPMMDAVPDSVIIRGNELLITTLTGFPFPPGAASVLRVNLTSGAAAPYVGNLTSAIDVQALGQGLSDPVAVLEFSTNMTQSAPGQLRMVSPNGESTVLAANLPTPTSMAVDARSGEIFVSHIFPGFITRVDASGRIPAVTPETIIPVVASLSGAYGSRYQTSMQLTNPHPFAISGRLVLHPQGKAGSPSDPSVAYTLAPFETRHEADFMAKAAVTGGASVDVVPAVGTEPITVTTIADVAAAGMPMIQVPQIATEDALFAGSRGTLIAPPDATRTRFNIGIRTFALGATMTLRVYDTKGAELRATTRTAPPHYFQQFSATELLGVTPTANQAVVVTIGEGAAIVYGVATDNSSGDATLQIARRTIE